MVSPAAKRRAVRLSVELGLGTVSQACRAMGLNRSSYYLESKMSEERKRMHGRIVELSREKPRYGYRRITAVLRREDEPVNAKRVQRIRREEGLQVRKRQRKLRRIGPSEPVRRVASRPGEVWSWDFVSDQTANGSRFRVLTLIDEYTRQCLALHAGWSIRAVDAIRVIGRAMGEHGAPEHLRSDNGPEFIAYAVRDWMEARNVSTIYIEPGAPWEQAWIESFHDKLRDEFLNREWFGSLREAQVLLNGWREEYNAERPHSSLGYLTPNEYALSQAGYGSCGAKASPPSRALVGGLVCSSGSSAREAFNPKTENQPITAGLQQ